MAFVLMPATNSSVTCLDMKAYCHLWSPPDSSPRGGSPTVGLFILQVLLIYWLRDSLERKWVNGGEAKELPGTCYLTHWGDRPDVCKQPSVVGAWIWRFFWTVLLAFNSSIPTCPSRLGSLWLSCFFLVPSWPPSISAVASSLSQVPTLHQSLHPLCSTPGYVFTCLCVLYQSRWGKSCHCS